MYPMLLQSHWRRKRQENGKLSRYDFCILLKKAWDVMVDLWSLKGSGGLVSCVDPVMSKHEDNVWLANLGEVLIYDALEQPNDWRCLNIFIPGMNVGGKNGKRPSNADQSHSLAPTTNTLGLPLIKQTIAEVGPYLHFTLINYYLKKLYWINQNFVLKMIFDLCRFSSTFWQKKTKLRMWRTRIKRG